MTAFAATTEAHQLLVGMDRFIEQQAGWDNEPVLLILVREPWPNVPYGSILWPGWDELIRDRSTVDALAMVAQTCMRIPPPELPAGLIMFFEGESEQIPHARYGVLAAMDGSTLVIRRVRGEEEAQVRPGTDYTGTVAERLDAVRRAMSAGWN